METEAISKIAAKAKAIRRRDLQMIHRAGIGHAGGDLSATDLLAALYFGALRVDPTAPNWPQRDRLILSKGHAAGALYATLAEAGFLADHALETFMQSGSGLNGHPNRSRVPGVESNTGALGHGLPVGVGMALSAKMDQASWRVFVLTGDGELQEGSNWEAAMAAAQFGLDNLIVIVDRNRLQQGDGTERTMALEPLEQKWQAFRWSTVIVDGHDLAAIVQALDHVPLRSGQPTCILAHTHKGQGVSFMRDRAEWHHRVPNTEELNQALEELR